MHDNVESILGKEIFKSAPVLLTLLCVILVLQIFFELHYTFYFIFIVVIVWVLNFIVNCFSDKIKLNMYYMDYSMEQASFF